MYLSMYHNALVQTNSYINSNVKYLLAVMTIRRSRFYYLCWLTLYVFVEEVNKLWSHFNSCSLYGQLFNLGPSPASALRRCNVCSGCDSSVQTELPRNTSVYHRENGGRPTTQRVNIVQRSKCHTEGRCSQVLNSYNLKDITVLERIDIAQSLNVLD